VVTVSVTVILGGQVSWVRRGARPVGDTIINLVTVR